MVVLPNSKEFETLLTLFSCSKEWRPVVICFSFGILTHKLICLKFIHRWSSLQSFKKAWYDIWWKNPPYFTFSRSYPESAARFFVQYFFLNICLTICSNWFLSCIRDRFNKRFKSLVVAYSSVKYTFVRINPHSYYYFNKQL